MELKEFKALVAKSKHKNWLNSAQIELNFPDYEQKINLIGVVELFKFCVNEIEFWDNYKGSFSNRLTNLLQQYVELKEGLINFLNKLINDNLDEDYLNRAWQSLNDTINRNPIKLPSKSITAKFILEKSDTNLTEEYFDAAIDYFTSVSPRNLYSINYLNGYLDAYLYANSIKTNSHEFSKYNVVVDSKIAEITQSALDSVRAVNTLVSDSEKEMKDYKNKFMLWKESTQTEYQEFMKISNENFLRLEKTYKENLILEEPAKYWASKKIEYQTAAKKIRLWLIGIGIFAAGIVFSVLLCAPEYIFKLEDKNHAVMLVRWSAIFLVFTVMIFVVLKLMIKIMLSYYHLARDAEERNVLTIFYLSLSKESNLDESQRNLIMQSLFARSETGLLKEDSNPTLPNDLIGKLLNNGK